jgi:hypothetical protein
MKNTNRIQNIAAALTSEHGQAFAEGVVEMQMSHVWKRYRARRIDLDKALQLGKFWAGVRAQISETLTIQ